MKYSKLATFLFISQISHSALAATSSAESIDDSSEQRKHVVYINSQRRGDLDPCGCGISMNLLQTKGTEVHHMVKIWIESSPFPQELMSHVKSAKILSGPYQMIAPFTVEYKPADVWPLNHNYLSAKGAVEITYTLAGE